MNEFIDFARVLLIGISQLGEVHDLSHSESDVTVPVRGPRRKPTWNGRQSETGTFDGSVHRHLRSSKPVAPGTEQAHPPWELASRLRVLITSFGLLCDTFEASPRPTPGVLSPSLRASSSIIANVRNQIVPLSHWIFLLVTQTDQAKRSRTPTPVPDSK
jgi:hypothetical protein